MKKLLWFGVAVLGALALGGIATHKGETINAMWLIVASVCVYALGYRFYSGWVLAKVLTADAMRATPAIRLNDGKDFVPTHKWIVFGHHFAAIAGAGPLVGPTLAAQFGYLPGFIWILVGAVIGGCVQDMIIMFLSARRDGRGLGRIARDELGPIGGYASLVGTIAIMVILIAVLGLMVVNAMKHSPWGTFTVFATIPIAMLVGIYLRVIRPGRVIEGSILGISLMLLGVAGGGWVAEHPTLSKVFDLEGLTLAWFVIGYGFISANLPVWFFLAPRDYLATFLKLGTVFLLAVAVVIISPEIKMPAVTQFIDGTGPVFGGKVFPFVFITIACGAISGFHSLVSSGTTPKLISNEMMVRPIGYGGMMLESFVAVVALIAATLLDPGVYFAINSPAGIIGSTPEAAVAHISAWGPIYTVTVEQMAHLTREMGETTLFSRTGGAPSLAVGMASIFSSAFGETMLAIWYHFAIMFEAIFILTTVDAGTRVGRFMIQDVLGRAYKPLGETSSRKSTAVASALIVAGWGYFLYIGVIDPNGGVNILWPLFGIANQLLAGIALSVATGVLVKQGKKKYAWVTAVPLAWLTIVTTTASWQKLFSDDVRVGFIAGANDLAAKLASGTLSEAQARVAPDLIFNQRLDAVLTVFFVVVLYLVIFDMLRTVSRVLSNKPVLPSSEAPFQSIESFPASATATSGSTMVAH
jgi:carbon starvation protein